MLVSVLFEPNRRGEDYEKMMTDYAVLASLTEVAVLFGVCSGKLAEGTNFRVETASAVIIVGILFPSTNTILSFTSYEVSICSSIAVSIMRGSKHQISMIESTLFLQRELLKGVPVFAPATYASSSSCSTC